jgi:hypothetical protein
MQTLVRSTARFAKVLLVFLCVSSAGPTDARLPAVIDLSQESANVEITGAAAGDYSGFSLASGDFNGDGYADLAILSSGAAPLGGSRRGIVDLVWGPLIDGAMLNLANPPGTRVFGTLSSFLASNISAGDLNGDGYDDLIWGQPSQGSGDGKVSVLLGRAVFPDTLDLATVPEGSFIVLGRTYWSVVLGLSVCACDMDGDGDDELVAAGNYGETLVIQGSDSLRSVYQMSQNYDDMTHLLEVADLIETGSDLACGDLDGDGREDLVIGDNRATFDPHPGLVRILFGHGAWRDTMFVSDPLFRTITLLAPEGASLSPNLALVEPEGQLFVGNPYARQGSPYARGEVYRTRTVSGLPDSLSVNSPAVLRSVLIGHGDDEMYYGRNLASGDFNADGWTDVAVVSCDPVGQTQIVYGNAILPDSVFLGIDSTITRILARDPGCNQGQGIEVADFNADGTDDLALGAWYNPARGRTYILFGIPQTTGVENERPMALTLRQNYPNPFNPVTTIVFTLPSAGHVRLEVFDVGGRFVQRLVDEWRSRDRHEIRWDGRDREGRRLASGVYFYRLTTPEGSITRKAVLLR